MVIRSFSLGLNPHLGPKTRYLLLLDSWGFVDVGRSLWREEGSVVYDCCWTSPAQSFLGPSPAGLITTFYCPSFEDSTTWSARSLYLYPPGAGWPSYNPRQWVPFSSPPTTHRDTVEVFDPASTLEKCTYRIYSIRYIVPARIAKKISLPLSHVLLCRGNVSTEPFPNNGCCTVAWLHSCYLAVGPHVTILNIPWVDEQIRFCRIYSFI
jgi:hypothetical protein